MSPGNGYNPMQWDCRRQGCFNLKKRPKIEMFADCLPGKIAFTDVDGLVEIKGNLLLLEWKDHQALHAGQRILFERMTLLCPTTVLIVEGDAEQMTVSSIRTAWEGRIGPPVQADLDSLRRDIREWADWAFGNPVVRRRQEALCR